MKWNKSIRKQVNKRYRIGNQKKFFHQLVIRITSSSLLIEKILFGLFRDAEGSLIPSVSQVQEPNTLRSSLRWRGADGVLGLHAAVAQLQTTKFRLRSCPKEVIDHLNLPLTTAGLFRYGQLICQFSKLSCGICVLWNGLK